MPAAVPSGPSRDDRVRASGAGTSASRARTPLAAWFVVSLAFAATWVALAPVPFLSEDWTWTARFAGVPTLRGALDPAIEPFRPLQHAWSWTLAHAGSDPAGSLPALARIPAVLLILAASVAIVALARRAGLARPAVVVALFLFAAFPWAKIVVWPAAIGGPGRVACELAALALLVRRVHGGSTWSGAAGLAAFLTALAFHESAILLPALLLAWIACVGVEDLRGGLARARAALRDPFVLASVVLAVLHAAHLVLLRPERVHVAKDLAALPANVVKAALALTPEFVRATAVDGLRGPIGTPSFAFGVAAVAVVGALFGAALRRGGVVRFAAIAVALDLGLAVLGTGFVQRYACLSAAFAALAVAEWARTRGRVAAALILLVAWTHDAWTDAREIRAAGAQALALAAQCREASGSGELVIVGVPDMVGAEEDVPFFNWGGAQFLAAHGVARPVLLVRTRAFRTNSDQILLTSEDVAARAASGSDVRVWSASDRALRPHAR